jgi:hypothetical protein
MNQRAQGIRAGHREWTYIGEAQLVLYWEPFAEPDLIEPGRIRSVIKHAFTVDLNHISGRVQRKRFTTLEEADAYIEETKDRLAVEVAKKAFGLN